MTDLRLEEFARELESGLSRAQRRDAFSIQQRWLSRLIDLRRAMLESEPTIVHFVGPGDGEQGLIFENERGEPTRISSTALAELFRLFSEQVDCVVLNGCYARVQAEAIAQHIPYVIGIPQTIRDRMAIEFSVGLYDALGAGRSVEDAYRFGCGAIELSGMSDSSPVLIQGTGTQSTDEPKRTDRLETFEFTIATLSKVGRQWQVVRQQGSGRRFVETLSSEASGQGLFARSLSIFRRADSRRADSVSLEMVAIPGGSFMMGSPEDEAERFDSESPQHEVSVASFFMGRYPVTQAQWKTVAAMPQVERALDADPFRFKGSMNPVEGVSWYDAVEFCARLSAHTGRDYRLPTEAEWEYVCRAGTTAAFHFGDMITTEVANYNGIAYADGPAGESPEQTTPVDQFGIANAYGLSDMHGNVYEWCQDHWHSNYEGAPTDGSAWLTNSKTASRVVRGGSWISNPRYCRSASRNNFTPVYRNSNVGFRVSCAAPRALM